jgi:beta-lactamase regulating signal transducer with metallopeptidase domain
MLPNGDAVWHFGDVAAGWVLTYFVHSTLMLLAAWLLTSRTRVSDAVREILWKSALVGGIATASIQTAVTREPLGGQLRLAPRTAPRTTMRVAVHEGLSAVPRFFVMRPRGTRWTPTLVVIWLTTAGLGLLWLTLGHARTLRALDDRTPLDDAPMGPRLRDLLTRAGIDRRVALTCSSRIASPVALPGGEICLPRRALLELDVAEQDSMLAHEVAHLVRRDPEWLIAARVIELVLFFQPLNRLARRRMQEIAEYLCDDWAVARTSRPVTLAKCLAAVAEWVGRAPKLERRRLQPMSAMVGSSGSPLVRRVGRILGARDVPRARTSRVALAVSLCALIGLAGVAPRVSVANAAVPERGWLLVGGAGNRIGAANAIPSRRDTILVFQTRQARISMDSLVRQRRGAEAEALRAGGNVVYRRVVIDAFGRDPVAAGTVFARPVTVPQP